MADPTSPDTSSLALSQGRGSICEAGSGRLHVLCEARGRRGSEWPIQGCRENEDRGLRSGDTVKWASRVGIPPLLCQRAKKNREWGWAQGRGEGGGS